MNKALLKPKILEFIKNYTGAISDLALGGSAFKEVSTIELIQQIESVRKAKSKLPTWFAQHAALYPPKLNLEQTSSEITAEYKSELVSGRSLADITGGFGVDSFYFAHQFAIVDHFETNIGLSEIAAHNFKELDVSNVVCHANDGLNHVLANRYDVIYADPSRRHASKGKVFFLKDCEPNIPDNLDGILSNCEVFMMKTSPMLDITAGLKELKDVFELHIVAVNNEVKELLWLMKKDGKMPLQIKTANCVADIIHGFEFQWESTTETSYTPPLSYLYEPNASIMKSGGVNYLAQKYTLNKLHQHTHLFTSEHLFEFPGRRFKIETVVPYSKKDMKQLIRMSKANVSTRNFPLSVNELRKKWKLSDGGDDYLFFVTLMGDSKAVLLCKKV